MQVKTKIIFGTNSLEKLNLTGKKYCIILSNDLDEIYLKKLFYFWKKKGIKLYEIKKERGEPYSNNIDKEANNLESDIDGFIGIGGGSVMDFIKALAIVHSNRGSICDFEFGQKKIETCKPIFLCPTTCGSGSEVTPYTVINNSETLRKFTLSSDLLYAKEAAINPYFLSNLPPRVKLNTSLDAFIHCLEALLNTNSSALTYPLSQEGLKIGAQYMKKIYSYDKDLNILQKAAKLSLFGGVSIAHNRTGLIHTLSVAIAKFTKIPHGRLNAQVLPFALDHNKTDGEGSLSKIISSTFNKKFKKDKDALSFLKNWISNFIDYSDFPIKLIEKEHTSIVKRVLEDKGLQAVSHGIIDEQNISILLKKMENEIRQLK